MIFAAGAFTGIAIEAAAIPRLFPKILHAQGGVVVPRRMLQDLLHPKPPRSVHQ